MEQIQEKLDELINSIKQTKEYISYNEGLKNIKENNELYEQVNEYRRRNLEVHLKSNEPYEDAIRLQYDFEEILGNPMVAQFIFIEQKMCKMLKEIDRQIIETFNIDIEFLDK